MAAAGLVGGALLTAAPAASATVSPTYIQLTTSNATVHTSTGRTLTASLLDFNSPAATSGTPAQLFVNVTQASSGSTDQSSWSFPMGPTTFTYNPSTGMGHLTTGTQGSPYAWANLTITRLSSASGLACLSGSMSRTPVKVTGTFKFATGSAAWGTFGSTTSTMTFPNTNYMYVDYSCQPKTPPVPCQAGTFWTSPLMMIKNSAGTVIGNRMFSGNTFYSGGAWHAQIVATRGVELSSPKNSSRNDTVTSSWALPSTHFASSPYTLHTNTTAGRMVTGSAVLSTTRAPSGYTGSCGTGKSQTQKHYGPASFTNGSSALTGHSSVGGNITVPNEPATVSYPTAAFPAGIDVLTHT